VTSFSVTFPELVCPRDLTPLSRDATGTLSCQQQHRYDVRDGIPRLLRDATNYAEAFGAQWRYYRTTQLDSHTKTSLSADRLRRCLGEKLWRALQAPAPRLSILEAGCGAGRFTEVLTRLPAAIVTSTDLSSSVEQNQENCPQTESHRVIQCDIEQLPFRPGQFDIVLCLGVVQHTPSTERTLKHLFAQVRPGGWLVIDHYPRSLAHYTRFGEMLLRPVLKRLPSGRGIGATRALTRWFFPLHRAIRKMRPAQMLLSRVSPVLTYYHALPQLDDRLQYEWAELDTHDSLTDWYKHVRSRREIRNALADLDASDIQVELGGNGIEARCRKPL
jgi:2-polyprenyl-3-methyl-5-hydroxy-6-metoxy-1,4-benzoquinol methylase